MHHYFVHKVCVATVLPGQSHSTAWRKTMALATCACGGGKAQCYRDAVDVCARQPA